MLRKIKQENQRSGFTSIEILEAIAAIALGGWLAEKVSSHWAGNWRVVILWFIRTIGSGIFFVIFLYGFGYGFSFLARRRIQKAELTKSTMKTE